MNSNNKTIRTVLQQEEQQEEHMCQTHTCTHNNTSVQNILLKCNSVVIILTWMMT